MKSRAIAAIFLCFGCLFLASVAFGRNDGSYLSRVTLLLFTQPERVEQDSQSRMAELLSKGPKADNLALSEAAWVNAQVKFRQGRYEESRTALAVAAEAAPRSASGTRVRAYIALLSGLMMRNDGNFGSALQLYRQAQQGFILAGDDRGQALALQSLGTLYADVGDGENALRYLNLSREAYSGDPPFLLSLSNNLGVALQTRTRHAEAISQFQRALGIADQFSMQDYAQRIRVNIVLSALHSGQIALARSVLEDIGSPDTLSSPLQRADVLGLQALLAQKEGRSAEAVQLIGRALRGLDSRSSPSGYRKLHVIAYSIYAASGDSQRALEQLEAVRRLDAVDAEITASNRAAVIAAQFQFAAQDARIARLHAQQQQQEAEYQRNVAVVSVLGSLIALTLLSALLLSVIRSRNRARQDGAELALANQHLERALAAKAEFLASTSHELRTPLNGILGMTQIMISNPDLPQALRSQVDLVHDAGAAMRALVDDILDVAKIEHGGSVITPRPTDIAALASRVIRLFEAQSLAQGITLRLDDSRCPPASLMIDPDRMTQILFNLVGNALKFTPEGCVTVEISQSVRQVEPPQLVIAVVDDGIGIAPEWHEVIFEMFRQVDGTRTRKFGGTGLGLAICRQLARAMGGDVSLVSAEGAGSRFTVTLPWQEATGVSDTTRPTGEASALALPPVAHDKDIMVVAHDQMRGALLSAMVRHAGGNAVVVDHVDQIAMLLAEADQICLIDAKVLSSMSDAIRSNAPVAARFVIAGLEEGDLPDWVAPTAMRVAFARNAVALAVRQAVSSIAGDAVGNSVLHQGVATAIDNPGPNHDMQRARTMSRT